MSVFGANISQQDWSSRCSILYNNRKPSTSIFYNNNNHQETVLNASNNPFRKHNNKLRWLATFFRVGFPEKKNRVGLAKYFPARLICRQGADRAGTKAPDLSPHRLQNKSLAAPLNPSVPWFSMMCHHVFMGRFLSWALITFICGNKWIYKFGNGLVWTCRFLSRISSVQFCV